MKRFNKIQIDGATFKYYIKGSSKKKDDLTGKYDIIYETLVI